MTRDNPRLAHSTIVEPKIVLPTITRAHETRIRLEGMQWVPLEVEVLVLRGRNVLVESRAAGAPPGRLPPCPAPRSSTPREEASVVEG